MRTKRKVIPGPFRPMPIQEGATTEEIAEAGFAQLVSKVHSLSDGSKSRAEIADLLRGNVDRLLWYFREARRAEQGGSRMNERCSMIRVKMHELLEDLEV